MQWYLWWVVWLEQTEKSNLKQPQPQTPVAELLMFDCIPQPTITLTLWFIINNLLTLQTILDAWRRIFLSGNINISLILPPASVLDTVHMRETFLPESIHMLSFHQERNI